MFDPSIGRWFGEDPIDIGAGEANLYRYVGNNPTNATDPSGLQAQQPLPLDLQRLLQIGVKDPGLAGGLFVTELMLRAPQIEYPIGEGPKLKADPVADPVVGFHGSFNWEMRWNLDKPADAMKGGWVIQKIRAIYPTFREWVRAIFRAFLNPGSWGAGQAPASPSRPLPPVYPASTLPARPLPS